MKLSAPKTKPIYVLGSPRSGTTILAIAIKTGANIPGYSEGHLLELIPPLIQTIANHYQKYERIKNDDKYALNHVSQSDLERKIIVAFRTIYNSLFDSEVWLDKTPGHEMIEAAPLIKKAWPDARFIYAKRRGIECVASRLRKFSNLPFESHCILWKRCMENWLSVKNLLGNNHIEVDQREISLNPQEVSEKIGGLLQFEDVEINKIKSIFVSRRPESTGSSEDSQPISIEQTDWSSEQIEIFRKHCREMMEKFGYSESSSYYLE